MQLLLWQVLQWWLVHERQHVHHPAGAMLDVFTVLHYDGTPLLW